LGRLIARRLPEPGEGSADPDEFDEVVTEDASEEEEEEVTKIAEYESILDVCCSLGMPRKRLRWHYRSRRESLISRGVFRAATRRNGVQMSQPRFEISVRLVGDALDPDAVSSNLHCAPSHALRKGDEILQGPFRSAAPTGIWSLRATERASFDEMVRLLLSKMSDDISVWKGLSAQFRCELFVGVFMTTVNDGFCISTDTLSALSDRRIMLAFDAYSHVEERNANQH
jgi:hypothetical protein